MQSLLEQYMNDPNSLSSFKQITLAQSTLQTSISDGPENPKEQVTCETPPPLIHRPSKRFLVQGDADASSPETKRLRQDNGQNYSRSLFKNCSNFQEEMFEKYRSIGSSSKQLRPPPPLMKQTGVDSNGLEHYRRSPQDHFIFTKETYKSSAEKNYTIHNGHGSKAISVELSSAFSPALKVDPSPREIEGNCMSSHGGYAFDHTAMPKIVAVHSISKKGEDTDEWERNKAFIAKVKGSQAKSGRNNSQMVRSASEQIKRLAAQAVSNDKDIQPTTVANERKKASENVSFERYVLYHLLSKYQGNVDQVQHILKQNLLQEWLSYCQGNADPRLQTFRGINVYELRKLHEIWSHLQRTKQPTGSIVHTTSKVQKSSGLQRQDNLVSAQNHPVCFSDSQSPGDSQQFEPAFAMQRQKNENPQNTSIHSARDPSKFGQHNSNGVIAVAQIESCSNENSSAKIQEKYSVLSQDSLRGTLLRNSSPSSPVVPSLYQNENTTRTVYSSTYKATPQPSPLRHFSFLNKEKQATCSSTLESYRGNSVMKPAVRKDVPGRLSRQGGAGAFCHNEKHVNMNLLEASQKRLSNSLVQEQERIKRTNSASLTLLQISQETSTPNQNKLLPSGKQSPTLLVKASRNNVYAKVDHRSVQSQHPSKEVCQLRTNITDAVRSQETKANYLWRFKGGKLISDSIDNGETTTEVDIQQKLAEYYSCNIQISQTDVEILDQEHKKVCGAAANGQRCYCMLGSKGNLQSTKEKTNPIQGNQNSIKKAEQDTEIRALLLQSPGSNMNSKTLSNASINPSTQLHSHNIQGSKKVHEGLIKRCVQPCMFLQDSLKGRASVDLKVTEDTTQTHVDLTNSFNTPQTYAIQKAMGNTQFSNENTAHRSIDRHNVNWSGETHKTVPNFQDKPSYNSFQSSQGFQLSSPGFSLCNEATGQAYHRQELQSLNTGLINSSAVQESQPCSTSVQITQRNLASNVFNHCLSPYTQPIQNSRASPIVSPQNSQENKLADTCVKKLYSVQQTPLPRNSQPTSPDAQRNQTFVSRDINTKQESEVKCSFTSHNEQHSNASHHCLHSNRAKQQSNPNFHVSSSPVRNQQSFNRCNTPSTVHTTRQCNVNAKISQSSQPPVPSVIRIAPKVNKTTITNEQPASTSNFSLSRTSADKAGLVTVAKFEKSKESEKTKEKQSSFHASLSTRKPQYNSLHQLAKKIAETRERFQMENIPWKKKILKSLEGVLMKKLKKIEKETGEEADLGMAAIGGDSLSENTT